MREGGLTPVELKPVGTEALKQFGGLWQTHAQATNIVVIPAGQQHHQLCQHEISFKQCVAASAAANQMLADDIVAS